MNRLNSTVAIGAVFWLLLLAPGSVETASASDSAPTTAMSLEEYLETHPTYPDPRSHMRTLIDLAKSNRSAAVAHCASEGVSAAECPNGVPFCALIVDRRSGGVVAEGCNHSGNNPVLHGEIAAINAFAAILESRGETVSGVGQHHDLYTTGESCAMCMGAIMWSNFKTLFFGSSVEFMKNFFSQIMISDAELTGLWSECQAEENSVRTLVVGGVLEEQNNALFEDFGYQFCSAATPSQTLGVAASAGRAYVGVDDSMVVLDVSDPAHPKRVGELESLANVVQDVSIEGDRACVALGSSGVQIVDVSDPSRPRAVGPPIAAGGSVGRCTLVSDTAYLPVTHTGAGGSAATGALAVYSVGEKGAELLSSTLTTAGAAGVDVRGSVAYVSIGESGLEVIDFPRGSSASRPAGIAALDPCASADGVVVAEEYAYVAAGDGGLVVVDISDPKQPSEVASVAVEGWSGDVAVSGHYAYVAADPGLVVFDISEPESPEKIATVETAGCGWNVDLDGSLAYLATQDNGLVILSVEDPAQPLILSHYGPETEEGCSS